MDENKKIEKLGETGEQSAEMVSGGVERHIPHRPINDLISIDPSQIILTNETPPCDDCGAPVYNAAIVKRCHKGKVYCPSCLAKHKTPAEEPAPSADAGLSN